MSTDSLVNQHFSSFSELSEALLNEAELRDAELKQVREDLIYQRTVDSVLNNSTVKKNPILLLL